MTKTTSTISIDIEVKQKGKEVLKSNGLTMSMFVEQSLRKYIKTQDKGGN